MREEELRRAYARAITAERLAHRAGCPTADALLALAHRHGSEAARLATLDHAMSCESCQKELELLRAIDVAARRESGNARTTRWRIPLALALAASVMLAIGLGPGRQWFSSWQGDTMRGTNDSVTLLHPASGASVAGDSIVLTWRSVTGASRYTVELLDLEGNRVHDTGTIDTTAVVPRMGIPAGEYRWWVVAELSGGERRSEARPVRLPPE